MFERAKVDNSNELGALSAELSLDDGRVLAGKFVLPVSKTLFEVLNSPGGFVEFAPLGEERQIVAKASIRSVKLVTPPKAVALAGRIRDIDGFDPHVVLGLKRDAEWDEIRHAYLALSKTYHPDRFASIELPGEVASYIDAMARRLNAAFAMLETAHAASRARVVQRAAPVYQSPTRG